MVVFTCGHCGESVQKPKVEKHYLTKCRNKNPNLSCMDCFKDFYGHDYEQHTKCITEEERYSAKGFTAKEKKGEVKQNAWVDMLQSVLDEHKTTTPNVRRILETISKHTNTPRKKPKFINFIKNSCGQKTNPNDIDKAWELISVKLANLSTNPQNKYDNQKKDSNKTEEIKDDSIKDENIIEDNQNSTVNDEAKKVNGTAVEEEPIESKPEDGKKLSKKQRKEEKKRQKYEAELKSAEVQPTEEEPEEVVDTKKGKKKKNKVETEASLEVVEDGKGKNKKRKRQDTVNSVASVGAIEIVENGKENIESGPTNKVKTQKKKIKVVENGDAEESICLHDQNVAKAEEDVVKQSDKFNWHAVIISLLEKKGEMPFKRLQKKVLSEFQETTGRDVDDRIADKFIKKLKSAPNVKVDKNRVFMEE